MGIVVPIREQTCASERYSQRVNPEWVRLLNLLEMNVRYQRCVGAELFTADGRRILDFLSGYCVHAVGHNHRHVVRALERGLERCGPAMIQTHVADLAGNWQKSCVKRRAAGCAAPFAYKETPIALQFLTRA
jgi:ornithine--oxo-acid transaminase